MIRYLCFITMLLSLCGQSIAQSLSDSVTIYFRQSHTDIDTAYLDNSVAIRHLNQLSGLTHGTDSQYVLTGINIVGAASPEGGVGLNDRLSEQRARHMLDFMNDDVKDSLATVSYVGRDWSGLRRMVVNDPGVPYRDEVLATLDRIIAKTADGETPSQHNLEAIKRLRDGVPYRYMYRNIFPRLRTSRLVLTYDNVVSRIAMPRLQPRPFALDIMEIDEVELMTPAVQNRKPLYWALKTNMLYDLLAVPNVSAEFYLGRNYSIVGNWMYGWWDKDHVHRYWRIYGGDIALRWWFGQKAHEKPLTGHHVGAYAGVVTYDFEFGGTGYMGGLPGRPLWDRCNYVCGLEYGYSKPISRRLNIDFTIGFGYLTGKYIVYDPVDRWYLWKETRQRRWFGPTKAEVSLVWLLGHDNYNKRKGGKL